MAIDSPKNRLGINQILVVYPTYTQAAYQPGGFYDYYNNKCGTECLTVKYYDNLTNQFSSSRNAVKQFKEYGFNLISDQDLEKNPDILKQYQKLVVLHSEYVTKKEFDIITSFYNVLYLYPNSLYGMVQNNGNGTITLIQGHGYKVKGNGFDWKDDNTRYEMDRDCKDIKFYKVSNGYQINCYPEEEFDSNIILNKILAND